MPKYIIDGGESLQGEVTPAGNKNEALPAIAACLLTDEVVFLENVPNIQDVLSLCEILKGLGAEVEWLDKTSLRICAKNANSYKPDVKYCSKIRASILLLSPLLSRFGKVELPPPGGDVIGARRIDTHFEGITALGGELEFQNPIKGTLKENIGQEIFLDEPSVTGTENIVMLAVRCKGQAVIHNAATEPHVVGLCNLLNKMGAKIEGVGSNRLIITGVKNLKGTKHVLGPDFMEIGSFLCLGAISKGKIRIKNVNPHDLRFVLKTLFRLGIAPEYDKNDLVIDGTRKIEIFKDLGARNPTIYSGPWPAYPSDLMSVAIVAATQASGTVIFHEKMYEGRMFFTDYLMQMGANIVLCDPHRVVITGPFPLKPANLSSPDVRAGMALLMAAVIAKGRSQIHNVVQIERGYADICHKLRNLGASIERIEEDY